MAKTTAKKKAKLSAAVRQDGWSNLLTKIGDAYRDKTKSVRFDRDVVDELTAEEIWLGDDIAARVIELPPKVQLQHGFTVLVSELEAEKPKPDYVEKRNDEDVEMPEADEEPGEPTTDPEADQAEDAEEESAKKEAEEGMTGILDELEAVSTIIEAKQWERAYGGSAILMGVDDGTKDLSRPVNEQNIKAVRYLIVLRPREIWPVKWNADPTSVNYGKPEVYEVRRESQGAGIGTATFRVHASRIIRFDGVRVSRRHTTSNRGWGDSILNRLYEPLADFQQSFKTVPNLIADFAQGVHKLKGLAELFAADQDDVVKKRIETIDTARSVLRSLIIDSEDDFQRLQTPVAGLAELLDRCAKRFAAAADMPVSLLMGDQPAGLNATGEQNTRWWYDSQGAERELKLRKKINRLVRYIFLSKIGPTQGKEPSRWKVQFANLWVPTQAEIADIRSKVANADKAYVDAGVLTPEEVAISRFGGDEWSMETHIDVEMRRLQADQSFTAVENEEGPNSPAAAAKMQAQLKGPGQPGEKPAEPEKTQEDPSEDE
jgi:phage-related protein (TIGR01555 family)